MKNKLLLSLIVLNIVCATKARAVRFRIEPAFSYGAIVGVDIFRHPQSEEFFIRSYPEAVKLRRFFPGGGIFCEYRFLDKVLSLNTTISYANRGFGHDANYDHLKTITSVHCLDGALLLAILPKGYGGISFYAGPKIYYIVHSKTCIIDHRGNDATVENVAKKFPKYNFGIVGGVKFEIDRIGIIVGAEVEKFFYPMNGIEMMVINSSRTNEETMKTEVLAQKGDLKTSGFRFYVGYDFARLFDYY